MHVNILCLDNPLGGWTEASLKEGVGGSETAVIGLARLLGDKGHYVTVYNDVTKVTHFGSVAYVPKGHKPESRPDADTWIVWRSPKDLLAIRDRKGRKVLWLHDLVPESEVIQYMHFADTIWVPSLFHRGTYPNIPDEKFAVLPSGMIVHEAKARRDPNLFCYTSDYNRGLDILLDIWPRVLFAYPDSKLVIAYGTQTQEAIARSADKARGDDLASRSWKYRWQLLEKRMKMKGITHVGKLGKPELARLYEQASLMAYPSTFPETQCLVVLDALAHGCVPVTSALGALQETNIGGYMLPPDADMSANNYLKLLLDARENVNEGRRVAARAIAEAYRWESLYPAVKREILGL